MYLAILLFIPMANQLWPEKAVNSRWPGKPLFFQSTVKASLLQHEVMSTISALPWTLRF